MDFYLVVAGILLLASFVGFIVYCVKGGNLIIGLMLTAVVWTFVALVYQIIILADKGATPTEFVNTIVQDVFGRVFHGGPVGYGETIAVIVFASWFGRILLDTGIAGALIRKVVELAGDKQLFTVVIVSIVSAGLFTSIFGPGSVIALGSIIMPILFSIGVKKKVAVGSFLFAVAAGYYVNGGFISQYKNINFNGIFDTPGFNADFNLFGWLAFGAHVLIMVAYIIVTYYFSKDKVSAWAVSDVTGDENIQNETKQVSNWTFIVPFIPIIMSLIIVFLGIWIPDLRAMPPIFGFIVGGFFGLLLTGNLKGYRKSVESVQKTLLSGITDVALLIGLLYALNIFSSSAAIIAPVVSDLIPASVGEWVSNPANGFTIVIIFIVLAGAALFRGPFMIFGSGIALVTLFASFMGTTDASGALVVQSNPLLLVLFFVQPSAIVATSCPTQSWNMWALAYAKYEPKQFVKGNIAWGYLICAVNMILAYAILVGF